MEARELRIGNLLITSSGTIVEVTESTIRGVRLNYLDIKPIPLTEEWLLKFGFEDDNAFFKNRITLYKQDGIFWCDLLWDCIDVNYVHQLQNLYYALTGEELTIKQTV
jgi:hypothetical protein